jgi:hypothetical protein
LEERSRVRSVASLPKGPARCPIPSCIEAPAFNPGVQSFALNHGVEAFALNSGGEAFARNAKPLSSECGTQKTVQARSLPRGPARCPNPSCVEAFAPNPGVEAFVLNAEPMSSECSTHKTVKARFWSCILGDIRCIHENIRCILGDKTLHTWKYILYTW